MIAPDQSDESLVAICLMHRRTRARRPTESLDSFLPRFDDAGRHVATPEALTVVSHAEELLDRATLASKAREGLARLPDIYRDAFVLRDLENLPSKEVAEVLGIDAAAVRQRAHRARLMLRASIEQHVLGCERCQAFVASYQATPNTLRDATDVVLPDDMRRSIEAWVRNWR